MSHCLVRTKGGVVGFMLATPLDFSKPVRYYFALKLFTDLEVLQKYGTRKGVFCA